MMFVVSSLMVIYGFLFILELGLIILFQSKFKANPELPNVLPKVTVLVCARNEEKNLSRCLNSLIKLDYPKDQLQILIGEDNSEDNTWQEIQRFTKSHDYLEGVKIENEKDGLIAKANVLSQLIDISENEYQVIIDADMEVQPNWLKSMVAALNHYDMVSGYTRVDELGNWAHVQYFDWQVVLHSMKAMADTFRPISILGNNMAFRKSAYEKVGGFRALGPTDVEDLGLLQLFQKAGCRTGQIMEKRGFAKTLPQSTFAEMIIQRCRWMNGVFTHHWLLALPSIFVRLWLLIALTVFYFDPRVALFIFVYGYTLALLKYVMVAAKTASCAKVLFYEPVFISLLDTFALIRILVKGKVSWKGRKF